MDYITISQAAKRWNVSPRSVRQYCQDCRIPGAFLEGKSWLIPDYAAKPARKTRSALPTASLSRRLLDEKGAKIKGGVYHRVQVELTYNSNHIEGSRLTLDQTRFIFETSTVGVSDGAVKVDDILETVNHFHCVDYLLDTLNFHLSEKMIKTLHYMLKIGTADSRLDWFAVGDYKRYPNEVSGKATVPPEEVHAQMMKLLGEYHALPAKKLDDLLDFHVRFERIHPFQDGNGRVGRLILFRECLKQGVVPFVIQDDMKLYYYRGLQEWKKEKGFLRDTCLAAQDRFKVWLDYFRIPY